MPDYVGDHFTYLIRGSLPARVGQLAFFISALLIPAWFAFWGPGYLLGSARAAPGLMAGGVLLASFVWYAAWIHQRLQRYRQEQPASYLRWFAIRRRSLLGRLHLRPQIRFARMQLRYLLLSQEPSATETLSLTMYFVRESARANHR
ncbi:MAG: hypothetical protein ACRDJG_01100 [Actinomycetota bacterium]